MAYEALKAIIRQYIKPNEQEEITGAILQGILLEMVNQLGVAGNYLPLTGGNITGNVTVSSNPTATTHNAVRLAQSGVTIENIASVGLNEILGLSANSIIYQSYYPNATPSTMTVSFGMTGFTMTGGITASSFVNSSVEQSQRGNYLLKADGNVVSISDIGGGVDMSVVWESLADDTNEQIASSHLTTALSTYATITQLGNYLPLTGGTLTGRLNVGGESDEYGIYTPWDIYAGYGVTSAGRIFLTGESVDLLEIRVESNGVRNSFSISTDDSTLNNNYWITRCMNIASKFKVGWTNNNDNTFFANAETGKVGIGTSSPSYKLDVNGQVGATGFIKSGGTAAQFLKADGSVTTLKTINGNSLEGSGDIVISGGSGNYLPLTGGTMTGDITMSGEHSIKLHNDTNWTNAYRTIPFSTSNDNKAIAYTSDTLKYNPAIDRLRVGGYIKTGSSDSYVLLGGGGHKLLSEIGGGGTLYDAEIEYLESTGTQWIDTGIRITSSYKIELSVIGKNTTDTAMFGTNNGSVYDKGEASVTSAGNAFNIIYPTSNWSSAFRTLSPYTVGTKNDISFTFSSCTINGNTTTFSAYQSYVANRTLYIYATNRGSAVGCYSGRIYYFKIYDGTTLVFDAIPVRVGNVGYLYDKVSGQLFGNSGTGDFVLGQDTGPGGGLPYLPLTGGTITGNLTINSGSDYTYLTIYGQSSNGSGRMWIDGDGFNFECSRGVLYFLNDSYFQGDVEVDSRMGVGINPSNTYQLTVDGQVGATGFVNTSDLRKKNIMGDVPINLYNVANAPLFKFTWNDEKEYSGQHIGSAAQYWQTILPELVIQGSDADMTLAMQYDVIALASAITVAKTVVNHEERIILLERENEALKKEIANLKSA